MDLPGLVSRDAYSIGSSKLNVSQGNAAGGFGGSELARALRGPATTGPSHGVSDKDKDVSLYPVEAQWILNVLEDTATKLYLLSLLTPDIVDDKVMDELDHELVVVLREHFVVEAKYLELLDARPKATDNALAHTEWSESLAPQLNEVDEILADSNRTLARLIKNTPRLQRRLREFGAPNGGADTTHPTATTTTANISRRPPQTVDFLATFDRLKDLMWYKLGLSAEQEKEMNDLLRELEASNRSDRARLEHMKQKLENDDKEHKKQLAQKDAKLKRLRETIEKVKQDTHDHRQAFEKHMNEKAQAADADYAREEKRLMDSLKEMDALFFGMDEEKLPKGYDHNQFLHWKKELQSHGKRRAASEMVQRAVDRYDDHMTEKHNALTHLTGVYETESKRLEELKKHFDAVDLEEHNVREEQKKIQIRRNQELHDDRRKHQTSHLMQKLFAGFGVVQKDEARRERLRAKQDAKEKANPLYAMKMALLRKAKEAKKQQSKSTGKTDARGSPSSQRRRSASAKGRTR